MIANIKIRRTIALLISLFLIIVLWLPITSIGGGNISYAAPDYSQPPVLTASSTILMDYETGQILYDANMNAHLQASSAVMMMTALVVLENMNINDVLVSDGKPVNKIDDSFDLDKDEEMTVNDLLHGMLMTSSNEAAKTLATGIDGNQETFVAKMNEKAAELGMNDTYYTNPTGVDDGEQYTSAYDLAILAREVMKDENFRGCVSKTDYSIKKTNKNAKRDITNINNMLDDSKTSIKVYGESRKAMYEGTVGVIEGESSDAGACIVAATDKDDMEFIAVVLNSKSDKLYSDIVSVLEYGYHNFEKINAYYEGDVIGEVTVNQGKAKSVKATPTTIIKGILPKGSSPEDLTVETHPLESIDAPVKAGDKVGTLTVLYNGQEIGTSDMVAVESVKVAKMSKVFQTSGKVFALIIKIVIGLVILAIIWVVYSVIKTEKKKRYRKKSRYYGSDYSTKEIHRIKRLK